MTRFLLFIKTEVKIDSNSYYEFTLSYGLQLGMKGRDFEYEYGYKYGYGSPLDPHFRSRQPVVISCI